jgi:pimeloyl-ACP methyl ester carboxylesterase
MNAPYPVQYAARNSFHSIRGLRYHVLEWGPPTGRPLVMLHGWMDVAASFQFVVDALAKLEGQERRIIAPDLRGFGQTDAPQTDSYWFPDYLGDLDALLDRFAPDGAVDLLGHSMGGNVVMQYAGVRPERIHRLINLEGFGVPPGPADQAPQRLLQWLDELKVPQELRRYDSLQQVAQRLVKNNPRLPPDKAQWLAGHWSEAVTDEQGQTRWRILGDPAHRRVNPVLSREEELLALWRRISAPTLFVMAERTEAQGWWGGHMTLEHALGRLDAVPQLQRQHVAHAGHMLHHDQPEALAALLAAFLR